MFLSSVRGLHLHQRLILKLATGQPITQEDEMALLRELIDAGRYHSDPDPKLFLFCLGRRQGKTMLATCIAGLLHQDHPTALYTLTPTLFTAVLQQGLDFNFQGQIPPTRVHRELWTGRSERQIVIDEMLACENWTQPVQELGSHYDKIVGLFSYTRGAMAITNDIPTMILSLPGDLSNIPMDPNPDTRWTTTERREHYPPPIATILRRFE